MHKFVNLTPHMIVLSGENGSVEIPPEPIPARISSKPGEWFTTQNGIPIFYSPQFGDVENLPKPIEGVTFIVSAMVAARISGSGRHDVCSPGTGPQDGAIRVGGQIVAVTRLILA